MTSRIRAQAAVIGAGPAGLVAAEQLARAGCAVTVLDHMASPGRKFLLAGRGGLNLTHAEPVERLLARYGAASGSLRTAILAFPPAALIAWCEELGQPIFVGSSARVFPRAMKSAPLLRAWRRGLDGLGVQFRPRHRWTGWDDDGGLRFDAPAGPVTLHPAACVLALGGASWPRMGSDGAWTDILRDNGIAVAPLRPSNCGVRVGWSGHFRARFAGMPLKRIALSFAGVTVRGEAVVTAEGLEGGAVYALSGPLRDALEHEPARLSLDLRPDLDAADLAARLAGPRRAQSLSNFLRTSIGLAPVAIALVHEALRGGADPASLAVLVKSMPVHVTGTQGIARAISSAGGVPFGELDERFMLRAMPGVFVAGEMLDWEAPTGGYLLQACFSTGRAAAEGALAWLRERVAE